MVVDHQVVLAISVEVDNSHTVSVLNSAVIDNARGNQFTGLGGYSVNTDLFCEEFSSVDDDRVGVGVLVNKDSYIRAFSYNVLNPGVGGTEASLRVFVPY